MFFLKVLSKACPVVCSSNYLRLSSWFAINLLDDICENFPAKKCYFVLSFGKTSLKVSL